MRLSIITPTLNPGLQLERAIRSVLDQRVDDIEHLIVDGGSTDETIGIVRRFSHLRFLTEPDEGIFDAMNRGIERSKGEWLYFLGADDVFADQSVLRDLIAHMSEDCDVVYGDVVSRRFSGRYDGLFDATKIRKKNISHQAIFFRRAVFERIGYFDTQYRSHADWDHNMRWILNRNVRKKYVDRVIAIYADGGFSSVNRDREFERDRLFRYLSYARSEIGSVKFGALWAKDLLLGLKCRDLKRVRRTLTIISGA